MTTGQLPLIVSYKYAMPRSGQTESEYKMNQKFENSLEKRHIVHIR